MKNIIYLPIVCVALSACVGRPVKILDGTWTSMRHQMPPTSDQKIMRISNIQIEYCVNAWSGSYGLMDEVVKKAESDYDIDYVKYPAFSQIIGKANCIQLAGEGYKLVR